jgi:hypothetical protein
MSIGFYRAGRRFANDLDLTARSNFHRPRKSMAPMRAGTRNVPAGVLHLKMGQSGISGGRGSGK